MAKDHMGEFSKNDKILLESFTPRMTQVFDDQFGKLRPDIQHKRKSRDYQRASKDKYKQKGHGKLERNQKHDVDIKETPQQRRFERYK
ncbi:unnamed protein product [Brassica oleracea var. botrytis]|uniref:(rape) hypothetical protein n=1 Tax=Brassica napus TaxID=3708 RepID=A0A816U8D9_BRANA|nr:unnamed protein product [Brassica napus]